MDREPPAFLWDFQKPLPPMTTQFSQVTPSYLAKSPDTGSVQLCFSHSRELAWLQPGHVNFFAK